MAIESRSDSFGLHRHPKEQQNGIVQDNGARNSLAETVR